MQFDENASAGKGTESDSSANIPASADQKLTTLDLALMPDYRRRLHLRHIGDAAPTAEDIEKEWLAWHEGRSGSRVYFVQRGYAPDAPIKIGTAKRPARRVAALQTACAERLVVLATCAGGHELEREYHQRFSDHKISGEWFRPSAALMQEIGRIRALGAGGRP